MKTKGMKKMVFTGIICACLIWLACGVAPAQSEEQGGCERGKGLVILVEFPDISRGVDEDFVRDRFKKLDAYVRDMSYGKACVDVDITKWLKVPRPVTEYHISPINLRVDRSRAWKLIQDSIDAADADYDFSRYSYVALFLGASFRQYGMVGLCGYPGILGWREPLVFKTKKGQVVPGGLAIFTYQAHVGTLFHDIAHIWGGVKDGKRMVPCLYDHDLQVKHPTRDTGWENALINMGYWDPLSCHFYERSLPPPGLSSWTKLRLGWIPKEKVREVSPKETTEVILGPLEDRNAETLVIRIPLGASQYYLIENRAAMGSFDPHLPGHGVLIMKADDTVEECRHGKAPVRLVDANPQVPHLKGAAFTLPDRAVFTDKEHDVEIRLVEKKGDSYRIRIRGTK